MNKLADYAYSIGLVITSIAVGFHYGAFYGWALFGVLSMACALWNSVFALIEGAITRRR